MTPSHASSPSGVWTEPSAEAELLPLIRDPACERFALTANGWVSARQYLASVRQTAEQMPACRHVVNLCEDRYRFAVGLGAALLRGGITLMPSDRAERTIRLLAEDFPDLLILADGQASVPEGLPVASVVEASRENEVSAVWLHVKQTAVIAFTSGSTGQPNPHAKTWGSLATSARLIAQALALPTGSTLLATVPPQHMYGFELSILLPMFEGFALDYRRPFFPADLNEALVSLPEPRVLVTTPVHLRSLVAMDCAAPRLARIVSATAPLALDLAREVEARFDADVNEIYGCTEAGSIASRRSTAGADWCLFPAVRVTPCEQGHRVEAAYLSAAPVLADVIEMTGDGRFRLHGRSADLVNIAGKRTSLGALNAILTEIDGVEDAAFYLPDDDGASTPRLTAFAVAPGLTKDRLLATLRQRLDPAFMPRVLHLVSELPRAETGKLPRAALQALAERLQRAKSAR